MVKLQVKPKVKSDVSHKIKKTITKEKNGKPKPALSAAKTKKIKSELIGISKKFQKPTTLKKTANKNAKPGKSPKIQKKITKNVAGKKNDKKSLKEKYDNRKPVVKINGIPHGFYEDQLMAYFKQFGVVTNVKVSRSQTTGKSKGVAFVEFLIPEVAQIAAETMNNYLMFKNLLKTTYIAPENVGKDLFKKKVEVKVLPTGKTVVKSGAISALSQEIRNYNKTPTAAAHEKRVKKIKEKLARKSKHLESLGINFDLNKTIVGDSSEKEEITDKTEKPKEKPVKAKPQKINKPSKEVEKKESILLINKAKKNDKKSKEILEKPSEVVKQKPAPKKTETSPAKPKKMAKKNKLAEKKESPQKVVKQKGLQKKGNIKVEKVKPTVTKKKALPSDESSKIIKKKINRVPSADAKKLTKGIEKNKLLSVKPTLKNKTKK